MTSRTSASAHSTISLEQILESAVKIDGGWHIVELSDGRCVDVMKMLYNYRIVTTPWDMSGITTAGATSVTAWTAAVRRGRWPPRWLRPFSPPPSGMVRATRQGTTRRRSSWMKSLFWCR